MGFSRIQILLLLLLPAFCVPRGVLLEYCFCPGVEADCCGQVDSAPVEDGCCDREPGEEPLVVSLEDCACCESLQVDDFEDAIPRTEDDKGEAVVVAWVSASPVPVLEASAPCQTPARAPPYVIPTGLRPGTAPLRL